MVTQNEIWSSTLDAHSVFHRANTHTFPTIVDGSILAIQVQPEKEGRNVLIKLADDNTALALSPPEMDLLTKISGYGGKPYWVDRLDQNTIYVVDGADQHIYRLNNTSNSQGVPEAERVTPIQAHSSLAMYTDLNFVSKTHAIAITEITRPDIGSAFFQEKIDPKTGSLHTTTTEVIKNGLGNENQSAIVMINLSDNTRTLEPLASGHDFYSNLVINDRRDKAAWVTWNHPQMPWNDTELWLADIVSSEDGVSLANQTKLLVDNPGCYCQLVFSKDHKLFFAADYRNAQQWSQNFWNIYCCDFSEESSSSQKQPSAIQVTRLHTEFGAPHWQYGDHRIAVFDENRLIAIGMNQENADLYLIDTQDLSCELISNEDHILQMMGTDESGHACFIHADKTHSETIAEYSLSKGLTTRSDLSHNFSRDDIATATHIQYEAAAQESAYGFFYAPKNANCSLIKPPPLIVIVHGGPTSRAYAKFDLQKQFWTNRGFAIFDVNHRGSTGYGRAFRDALYGEWGNIDTLDIKHGIQHLIDSGAVDPNKIFIRGKSAGGFAVLRALTQFPKLFCAGASYYGIGNLTTLAASTHKFEKYYVDMLIQERYDEKLSLNPQGKYFTNSPINFLDRLNSPMILFQGGKDKVVPPQVSREVVEILKAKNIDYEYIEFPSESHGFRKPESNIMALEKELAFYCRAMTRQSLN